jgi:hypothetical protein
VFLFLFFTINDGTLYLWNIYIYMYIYVCMYVCMYVYVYVECVLLIDLIPGNI